MELLTILAWLGAGLLALLILYTFVLEPWLVRRKNQKVVTEKMIDRNSKTRYFKFRYEGWIYYETPTQANALRLFQSFKNQQTKFEKLYNKGRKVKEKKRRQYLKTKK
ncbi:MAG: hypothetical protein AAF634_05040 [Bacteroidota bacterium]